MGLPLAQVLDDYVQGERIVCSWHGAVFAVEDGRCLGGPCGGARLSPWPVGVRDGTIVTV
jgi:nitrite reductase/ring-hydroxylating ferredoxin subunit